MPVRSIPIILSGSLKIMRQDEDGKETFLYFLRGDTCAMSLTCCSANRPSSVRAVAEDPTELILVPVEKLDYWMTIFPSWKTFVFKPTSAVLPRPASLWTALPLSEWTNAFGVC